MRSTKSTIMRSEKINHARKMFLLRMPIACKNTYGKQLAMRYDFLCNPNDNLGVPVSTLQLF